jgi:hypothetical protein
MAERPELARVLRAVERARQADADAREAHREVSEAIRAARDAGIALAAIARALGVSRQRVQQLARRK